MAVDCIDFGKIVVVAAVAVAAVGRVLELAIGGSESVQLLVEVVQATGHQVVGCRKICRNGYHLVIVVHN